MTATSTTARAGQAVPAVAWLGPIAIVLALAAIVAARVAGSRAGIDPLLVGAGFGGLLVALALAGDLRGRAIGPSRGPRLMTQSFGIALGLGVAVGIALASLTILGPAIAGSTYVPGLGRPGAAFVPWALITIVVASAEEGVLRGALFDRIERLAGLAPAIALTTLAFALMHVPLYGWHVVPLDLAVGLVLAGLRLWTRGLVAPAAAHVVADLATWWL